MPIEAARAQQRRIEHVGTVSRGDDDHTGGTFEAVHLYQQLIQGLFALVVTATEASAALTAYGVDFVDEYDAGCILFRLLEHVANPRRADTDKHFHEIGTGNAEEWDFRFASNGAGEQGFTGTGRANHQYPARNASPELLKFLRVPQELDQFGDFFFGFVHARHIGKCHLIGIFVEHFCPALAEGKRTAAATPLHLAHEKHPNADNQQEREPGDKHVQPERALFFRLGIDAHFVMAQIVDHENIAGRIGQKALIVVGQPADSATIHLGGADLALLGLIHEFRVGNRVIRLLAAELIE